MKPKPYRQYLGTLSKETALTKAQDGIYTGKPLLGYMKVRWSEIHVPDPERLPIVRLAFRLAGMENKSLREILKRVRELGLTTNAGKSVSLNSLHLMLTNPFYAGWIRGGGQLIPGQHEAIVSKTEFETVQRNLKKRRH